MRISKRGATALAALLLSGCSLDLNNPNAPTAEAVTTSPDGVIALATGLQGRFAVSYHAYAYTAGLVTDEFAATSAATCWIRPRTSLSMTFASEPLGYQ